MFRLKTHLLAAATWSVLTAGGAGVALASPPAIESIDYGSVYFAEPAREAGPRWQLRASFGQELSNAYLNIQSLRLDGGRRFGRRPISASRGESEKTMSIRPARSAASRIASRTAALTGAAAWALFCATGANAAVAAPAPGYAALEAVAVSDPRFPDALTELQKIHYREADWQRFFGYARFYRERLLADRASARIAFRARALSLEILALAKHCRWAEAGELAYASLALADATEAPNEARQELLAAAGKIRLQQEFPTVATTADDVSRPFLALGRETWWRVSDSGLRAIPHPRQVGVVVERRCEP